MLLLLNDSHGQMQFFWCGVGIACHAAGMNMAVSALYLHSPDTC